MVRESRILFSVLFAVQAAVAAAQDVTTKPAEAQWSGSPFLNFFEAPS